MKSPIKTILVLENHPLMCEAFCAVIASEPNLVVIGQVTFGTEALRMVARFLPDAVLFVVDPSLPENLLSLLSLRKSFPRTLILTLANDEAPDQEEAIVHLLSDAVISRNASPSDILQVLRKLQLLSNEKE